MFPQKIPPEQEHKAKHAYQSTSKQSLPHCLYAIFCTKVDPGTYVQKPSLC